MGAIEDSGDIAADGAAPDNAEEEQSPVDLDSILENPAPSRGVTADGDGDEADNEEDNSEGEDEESAVDSDNERDDMGVEDGGEDELQGGESTPTSNQSNVGGGALVSDAVIFFFFFFFRIIKTIIHFKHKYYSSGCSLLLCFIM